MHFFLFQSQRGKKNLGVGGGEEGAGLSDTSPHGTLTSGDVQRIRTHAKKESKLGNLFGLAKVSSHVKYPHRTLKGRYGGLETFF